MSVAIDEGRDDRSLAFEIRLFSLRISSGKRLRFADPLHAMGDFLGSHLLHRIDDRAVLDPTDVGIDHPTAGLHADSRAGQKLARVNEGPQRRHQSIGTLPPRSANSPRAIAAAVS